MPVTLLESSPEFKRAIAQPKLTVVDFYAVWCGPCKAIAPRYEALAAQYPGVGFYKVNVDNMNDVAREYGVTAMPTFKLFKAGKVLDTVVGANIGKLESTVRQLATPAAFEGVGRTLGSGDRVASPTSPTTRDFNASSSAAAAAAPSASRSGASPAAASAGSAPTTAASRGGSADATNNNVLIWIAVVFLAVYWYMGQQNRSAHDADRGF
ncbi:thioredoxin trx1 [Blastocladiella emersonii ATCC 22665]|nr:thioredoxin trx1 [Blastocladiella emersonii ATCC 22665]